MSSIALTDQLTTAIVPNPNTTVQKVPGGPNAQVFIGTSILLGLCAIPVFFKDTKTGHDLFSQEKPQAIVDSEVKLRKAYVENKEKEHSNAGQGRQ